MDLQCFDMVALLPAEKRLHFYELLAHNLTVAIRGIWSDSEIDAREKVTRIKWVNEIMHSITAKIWVLRLNDHEWTESDSAMMVEGFVSEAPPMSEVVGYAIRWSYESVSA